MYTDLPNGIESSIKPRFIALGVDEVLRRCPTQHYDPVMGHTYNLHIQRSPIDQIADQLAYTKLIIHN